jgi:hypothetical protein
MYTEPTPLEQAVIDAERQPDPYLLLGSARSHLCDGEMTPGKAQAWYLLGELMEEIIREESIVPLGCAYESPETRPGVCNGGYPCGKPAKPVNGIALCPKHEDYFDA